MNDKALAIRNSLTDNDDEKKQKLNLITNRDIKKLEALSKRQVLSKEKASVGMFYGRFRKRFLNTIEALIKTSMLLPEKEKNHVLTADTLKFLIDAFLTYEPEKKSDFVVNERAFKVAYLLAMRGESGFDMMKHPYITLLDNYDCKKRAMLLLMQLSKMKFLGQ